MQPSGPTETDIVLLGAGAAHLEVLRRFARRPGPRIRLTLVAPEPETPCTARLPALIRGDRIEPGDCIDLALLAAAAGARLILADAAGIDLAARMLQLTGRPPMPFDLLSVDLAGESKMPEEQGGCIPISPPSRFLKRLPALEAALPDDARLAIIGGDAATIEQTLALARRLRGRLRVVLVSETPEPLAPAPPRARRAIRAALVEAGVELASAVRAGALTDGRLALSDGSFLAADVALWAGGTLAPAFLAESGLACDASGRVLVNAGQRSVSDPCIFAAGDCAAASRARRLGPLLWVNLRRAARGRRLAGGLRWWPPPRIGLAVLDLGAGRAVAWCRGLAVCGKAVWRGKDWLDRRRMRRYAPPLRPTSGRTPSRHAAAQPGEETPDTMPRMPAPDALVGLGTPHYAAVLTPPAGQALVQTVASLRACRDDPFVFGQIAAAHALSDLYVMAAQPWTALAIAAVPPGAAMQADSEAMLAGASDVLSAAGCTLVGTRCTAAAEASLGLVLSGLADPARLPRKPAWRPGDFLLLTKLLGTGIVLAAHSRGMARGRWLTAAIDAMLTDNAAAARVLRAHGAAACVAVAERGLIGHLHDTLRTARVSAVLWPDLVQALPGALELAATGVFALAAPSNALALPLAGAGADPRTALLADPQISGGLVSAVPPARAEACLAALQAAGLPAAIVGAVEAPGASGPLIRLEPGQGRGARAWHPAPSGGAAVVQCPRLPGVGTVVTG